MNFDSKKSKRISEEEGEIKTRYIRYKVTDYLGKSLIPWMPNSLIKRDNKQNKVRWVRFLLQAILDLRATKFSINSV